MTVYVHQKNAHNTNTGNNQMFINSSMNKQIVVYSYSYYSTISENEPLVNVTVQMDLKSMLSKKKPDI